jgi:transposase
MVMVGGLDLHRSQITFDVCESVTGQVWRGRLWQPDRQRVRRWLVGEVAERAQGQRVRLAVEGCTGWRFVVEEIERAGFEAYVAESAETQDRRGCKRRAKTDRSDARLLRDLLEQDRLPLSWIPPTPVLEWRERIRLYKTLLDQRTAWTQRIHAELYQHGVGLPDGARMRSSDIRTWLLHDHDPTVELSPAARQRLEVSYQMLDAADAQLGPLRDQLAKFATRQRACRTLIEQHYGVGPVTSVAVWSELGDCQRFERSDQAVRHSGLDITIYSSNDRRSGGYLSRQGPATLRWAVYEAGKCASRSSSPDYDYYQQVRARHNGKRAALSVARKILRRCYHTLRNLDTDIVYSMPN